MSKHDEERVTKEEVKKLLADKSVTQFCRGKRIVFEGMVLSELWTAIDQLPAVLPNSRQVGEIKSREQIGRAIKNLEESFKEMKTQNYPWGSYAERMQQINLLKWALNQPQEEKGYPGSTWTDKELLAEEKKSDDQKS